MKMIQALLAPEAENPHGVSVRPLHDTEHVAAVMITLEPGQSLKLHRTPVDAFFFALEGEPTVEVGGERRTIAPWTLVDSPALVPHRILNESMTRVRVLVVKTPKPTTSGKIL
ncbi:MAG: cupin domain-containing protein [Candidatus Aminicenantes bacterium]|nr:cupin domain-containing protein [Candidatus Aminicenantes bacterium]